MMPQALFMTALLAAPVPFAAAAANSSVEAASSTALESRWVWTARAGQRRPVVIKLVRGSVRVTRRAGPIKIAMRAVSQTTDPAVVRYDVDVGAQAITVMDRYPSTRLKSWTECLPPADGRGGFWNSDVRIEAVVLAPEGLPVRAEVMERTAAE